MTRILVVEDHALMRLNLVETLSPVFTVVGEASDGEQAILLTRRLAPDLVLMDLGLPILSGIEATRLLKQEQPQLRVLVLTSHEEDESVFGALSAGADGYCLKGTTGERLIQAVQAVLGGATWLDAEVSQRVLRDLNRTPVPNPLSERERGVLKLIAAGLSNPEIAQQLFIALGTVRIHVSNILAKLEVNDRVQAAVRALREGWIR
ncbi:response regulator transcription factor [Candidatus Cyanaurora vandensis]|uniref:response regulator n=1 Tax=Candidatus Cyanaurora vandensis TaxID=2714958 RepID=UPI002580D835|nr:response regulator transcription factor [Candidatus Cyanaurora vandensis]